MLTGHINIRENSMLVLGVTAEDLSSLQRGLAVTLDGSQFGLPNIKILVMPTDSEETFRAEIMGMIEALGGVQFVEVQPPDPNAGEPS